MSRRSALLLALLPFVTAGAQRDTQTVVFACEHGTVKSTLAMALFNRMAAEKGIPYKAVSRGVAPDSAMPPFMRTGLTADGLFMPDFRPTKFSDTDVRSAAMVISFDQPSVLKTVAGRRPGAAWDNTPAVSANYAIARDSMRARVRQLVDSLARASHHE